MRKNNSKATCSIAGLFPFKKIAVMTMAAVMVLMSAGCNGAGTATESTGASTAESFATESMAATDAAAETTPVNPIIYPEELFQYQLPDRYTNYLQTDAYTTIDNNVFMDALIYTGYNITKHRNDGMMWQFVYAEYKKGLGYLSKISYGDGCTGYETDSNGLPNIARFEEGDLVCASFVTYVYFNYLPNVAGIDTSSLAKPNSPVYADDWYTAARDWVAKGYSEYIPFEAYRTGAIGESFINFTPSQEIPIGSIVIFCNPKTSTSSGSHVAIYAGYANGYDWLYHVGNKNGPEFCSIQRMNFGPNARFPIAIITPPNNIRFSPVLEIEVLDKTGTPVVGSEFILKHPTTGKEISLGATDENGKITRTDLSYGDYELVQVVPEGYTCEVTTNTIQLSSVNNSYNKVLIVNTKTA